MPAKKKSKTTKKRTTAYSTAKKKKTGRKSTSKQRKSTAPKVIRSAYSKTNIINYCSERLNIEKKQTREFFECLSDLMQAHLSKGSAKKFILPGLLKITLKHKPAVKSRRGPNPFTGEIMTFKAKPARNVVKVQALKHLKDMAS